MEGMEGKERRRVRNELKQEVRFKVLGGRKGK